MGRLSLLRIVATILVTSFLTPMLADAASKTKKAKKADSKVYYYYEQKPFDDSQQKLQPNFLGHNYLAVRKKLSEHKDNFFVKDEFETSEQYNKRMVEYSSTVFTGTTKLNDLVAFVTAFRPDVSYDADTQVVSISPVTRFLDNSDRIRDREGITLTTRPPEYSYYTASTAFGVKRKIRHASYVSVDAALENGLQTDFEFNLSPHKAKAAKDHGHLVLVGFLEPPFNGISKNETTATIDNPFEETDLVLCLLFRVTQIWLINDKSGEVYYKYIIQASDDVTNPSSNTPDSDTL